MRSTITSKDNQLQAIIYTNVSATVRLRGDDTFNQTHRDQAELCRAKANQLGLKVVSEYHDELDGDHDLKAFLTLIERLQVDRNIEIVLIPDFDAFGRKILQQDELLEVITACGARVVAAGSDS